MKKYAFFFLCGLLTSCASRLPSSEADMTYSTDLFIPISFLENPSHLAMNVNYPPVEKIRQGVEKHIGQPLKNRGEAHITVLTPPELKVLGSVLTIEDINKLAVDYKIQQSTFEPLCVGRGRLQIDGKEESTYFVVVDSADLVKLRGTIKEAYVAGGGKTSDFNETKFYPHITLGYTKRDLHLEDGIIKDKRSCVANLKTQP